MRRYLPICAILALAGCVASPPPVPTTGTPPVVADPTPTDPLSKLAEFTVKDLMAASVDAKAQTPPDITASQCYDYLIQLIPSLPIPGQQQTVGAVLAFQHLRDLNAGLSGQKAGLKALNLACAPLVIDTQTTVNKLLLIGSGAAGIPGLGGLGTLLP